MPGPAPRRAKFECGFRWQLARVTSTSTSTSPALTPALGRTGNDRAWILAAFRYWLEVITPGERKPITGNNPRVAPDLVREHAAKLADLTDDVLFADVWERPGLSPRDRSLITVAALVALGRDAQLTGHLRRALDNGLTRDQLAEAITHLAFYAGWPAAMSAVGVLATITGQEGT